MSDTERPVDDEGVAPDAVDALPEAPAVELEPPSDRGARRAAAVAKAPEVAPEEVVLAERPNRAGGALDVVRVGDRDGHAAWVARLLGLGDSIEYTELIAGAVTELQKAAGVEPDGVVGASTWPLLLPELRLGSIGPEVGVLRLLLGLPVAMVFDDETDSGVRFIQAEMAHERTGVVDREVWAFLLEAA